jgi:hypothetical protein
VDRIFNETSKAKKQRIRVYDEDKFYDSEKSAPTNAPKWSIDGYRGSLYDEVKKFCSRHSSNEQLRSEDHVNSS